MANFAAYPKAPFTESTNFLARDPSGSSQVVRVQGRDILEAAVNKIIENGDVVKDADTVAQLIATDFPSGTYVVVGGNVALFDGGQAIYRVSDPGNNGISMNNGNEAVLLMDQGVYQLNDMSGFNGYLGLFDNQQVSLLGWHPGSDVGGGVFYWDSSQLKTGHNGGTIISPTVPWTTVTADFLSGVGETDPIGSGCWIRCKTQDLSPYFFGVKADNSSDDYSSWNAVMSYYNSNRETENGAGDTSSFSVWKMSGVKGVSLTSEPISLPAYFRADFSQTKFERHPGWSEPAGTHLLTSTDLYQADFGGLVFDDVDYCLKIFNPNLDQGVINVKNFHIYGGSNGIEVDCQSSLVLIENFKSDNCVEFLDVEDCDQCVLDKGWITQGTLTVDTSSTILLKEGLLHIKDVLGVPKPHTGNLVAWIKQTGGFVKIDDYRFGAEPGSCAALNCAASADQVNPILPTGFEINSSQTFSIDTQGGSQTSCIVRLFNLPNTMIFQANRGMTDTQQIFTWGVDSASQGVQIDLYEANPQRYTFECRSNQPDVLPDRMPENIWVRMRSNLEIQINKTSFSGTEVTWDSGYRPHDSEGDFMCSIIGGVRAAANPAYRSTITGVLSQVIYFNGSSIVRKLEWNELSSVGGGTAVNLLSVTPYYWDGATESSEAALGDQSQRIRLKVNGFDSGVEPFLSGVFRTLTV